MILSVAGNIYRDGRRAAARIGEVAYVRTVRRDAETAAAARVADGDLDGDLVVCIATAVFGRGGCDLTGRGVAIGSGHTRRNAASRILRIPNFHRMTLPVAGNKYRKRIICRSIVSLILGKISVDKNIVAAETAPRRVERYIHRNHAVSAICLHRYRTRHAYSARGTVRNAVVRMHARRKYGALKSCARAE